MPGKILRMFLWAVFTIIVQFYSISGGSLFASVEAGCYESLGYGLLQRTSAIGNFDDECSNVGFSGFSAVAGKCYYWTGEAQPTEFDCSTTKQCGEDSGEIRSTGEGGSNYLAQLFAPNSANCDDVVNAVLQGDRNAGGLVDPVVGTDSAPPELQTPALESASNSLHTADANTSTKLFNVTTIVVKIIGALAGIAIVGSLVVAGVQYATAGDNSGSITKAKTRIAYTLIALVIYIMVYYVAVWLIPS